MLTPDGELKSLRILQAEAKQLPSFNYHTPLGRSLEELASETAAVADAYRLTKTDSSGEYPNVLKEEVAQLVVKLMHIAACTHTDLQIEVETILNGGERPDPRYGNIIRSVPSWQDEDDERLYGFDD